MTIKELEAGKAWITETLIELAEELNVPLESQLWANRNHWSAFETHLLTCSIKGSPQTIAFSYSDLHACPTEEVVQLKLKARLKGFLYIGLISLMCWIHEWERQSGHYEGGRHPLSTAKELL
jgi:hypothetical protein